MGIFDGYLLMSDIDGTFENKNFKCPKVNVDAIEYFKAQGGKFAFASGRMSDYLAQRKFDLLCNAPYCLCNGSFVYDTDTQEVLYQKTVPHTIGELAEHITPYIDNNIDKFIAAVGTTMDYHEPIDPYNVPCDVKDMYPSKQITVFYDKADASAYENALKADPFFDDCFVCRSWSVGVEVLNKVATKGDALKFIKEYCGCHTAVAIGDYGNDFTMLEAADIAAAVECEYDGLKKIADIVTCKCKDGAVADLIKKLEERINNR